MLGKRKRYSEAGAGSRKQKLRAGAVYRVREEDRGRPALGAWVLSRMMKNMTLNSSPMPETLTSCLGIIRR